MKSLPKHSACGALLLILCVTAGAQGRSPKPARWLLDFQGKSTNKLVTDARFPAFLRSHVTTAPIEYWLANKRTVPAKDALEFLHGPPDDVRVLQSRYVVASACVPHDCMDRGLLWVDTSTGTTVFVASVYTSPVPMTNNRAHLWIFANAAMQASTLPATLLSSLNTWSAEPNGDGSKTAVVEVTLVEPDGSNIKLSPADAHVENASSEAGK